MQRSSHNTVEQGSKPIVVEEGKRLRAMGVAPDLSGARWKEGREWKQDEQEAVFRTAELDGSGV